MAVIRFDWGMCVRGCQRLLVREKSTQWGPLDMVLERLGAQSCWYTVYRHHGPSQNKKGARMHRLTLACFY